MKETIEKMTKEILNDPRVMTSGKLPEYFKEHGIEFKKGHNTPSVEEMDDARMDRMPWSGVSFSNEDIPYEPRREV